MHLLGSEEERALKHASVRADTYGGRPMPQWILLLVLVIVAWLVLSVVGGLLVGRLIGFVVRQVPHPRRRTA
jgi:nitrate reductase NapE component